MDRNFALEPEETEAGYVLACQSHPVDASRWSWTSTADRPPRRRAVEVEARSLRSSPFPSCRTCSILTLRQMRAGPASGGRAVDFTFTEEQQAAVEAAKAVFAGVAPDGVPSPALTPGAVADDFDRALWAQTRRRGPAEPAARRRATAAPGLDAVALCLVLRESAKVLARVPLLETSRGRADRAALRRRGVEGGPAPPGRPGRAGPDRRRQRPHRPRPRRTRRDQRAPGRRRWVLDGVQTAVPWAHDADFVARPAPTPARAVPCSPWSPASTRASASAEQVSTSGERLGRAPAGRACGSPPVTCIDADGAWEWLRDLLTTGTCALALGLGRGGAAA